MVNIACILDREVNFQVYHSNEVAEKRRSE